MRKEARLNYKTREIRKTDEGYGSKCRGTFADDDAVIEEGVLHHLRQMALMSELISQWRPVFRLCVIGAAENQLKCNRLCVVAVKQHNAVDCLIWVEIKFGAATMSFALKPNHFNWYVAVGIVRDYRHFSKPIRSARHDLIDGTLFSAENLCWLAFDVGGKIQPVGTFTFPARKIT